MPPSVAIGVANAYDFAFGNNPQVPPLVLASSSTGTGSQTYTLVLGQTFTADGRKVLPLVINGSLTVGTGANAETVVITAVSASNPSGLNQCTFTASFANAHGAGEIVSSGSLGLQEAAVDRKNAGGGLVALTPSWFLAVGGHAAGLTALVAFKSLSAVVTVLDYSGVAGVFSYTAAAGSVYASTTHVLY